MRILILSFCLIASSSLDGQWIYPNDQGVAIEDMWFKVPNRARLQESMDEHPCLAEGQTPEPANTFFGITDEGELWTGNVDPNQTGVVIDNPDILAYTQYIFPPVDFQYVKLINNYEDEEDPDAFQTNSPVNVSSESPIPITGVIQGDLPNEYIYASNDLVHNQDVVITIFPEYMTSGERPYLLCYDGAGLVNFEPAPFSTGSTNCVNVESSVSFEYQLPNDQVCALFTPEDTDLPVFINLNVFLETDVDQGQVQFTLVLPELSNEEAIVEGQAIPVESLPTICIAGLYNDPNFTRLECVWIDEDGNKFGRYHVECFNDGQAGFEELVMSVELPDSAIIRSLIVDEFMVKCNTRCSRYSQKVQAVIDALIDREKLKNDRTLELTFDGGLCGYDHQRADTCRYTAWFEFSLQFTDGTDLALGDLQPGQPMTTFETTNYDIHPYYDDKVCYTSRMLDDLALREPDSALETKYRTLSNSRSKLCQLGRLVGESDCAGKCLDKPTEISCKKSETMPPVDDEGLDWRLIIGATIALLFLLLFFGRRKLL